MNALCRAIKPDGGNCKRYANTGGEYCPAHEPQRAAERSRHASRAGRASGHVEVRLLKEEVKQAIAEVRAGELDRQKAAAMFAGYRVLKDYLSLERDLLLLPELAERIKALENPLREDYR